MANRAGLIWIDAQGERVMHVLTTNSGVGSIESAVSSHSNAVVIQCWEGLLENYSVVPSTSAYNTVRVTAVLTFVDSSTNSEAKLFIPSPDTSIFNADGDTVDPLAVADVISAAIGNLIAGSGNAVDAYVGGVVYRTRFTGISTVN